MSCQEIAEYTALDNVFIDDFFKMKSFANRIEIMKSGYFRLIEIERTYSVLVFDESGDPKSDLAGGEEVAEVKTSFRELVLFIGERITESDKKTASIILGLSGKYKIKVDDAVCVVSKYLVSEYFRVSEK